MTAPTWIKELAKDWGHALRRFEAQLGALQGTMGRIYEEGIDGAAIRSFGQRVPYQEFPKDVQAFHRAFMCLSSRHQRLLWLDYKKRLGVEKKWKEMGMARNTYYRERARALDEVQRLMGKMTEGVI